MFSSLKKNNISSPIVLEKCYWSLLLLLPYICVNHIKWQADIASPYSNYWSNSDSLGPLLWLEGSLSISDETVWGKLVSTTTLPSLYIVSKLLNLFGKTPYDFQNLIVWSNIFIGIGLSILVGKKIFQSIPLGIFVFYFIQHGLYLSSMKLGYNVGFYYGPWSSYGAFTGILSMHLGILALALFVCDFIYLSVFISVIVTLLQPATGAIVAFILLTCLISKWLLEQSAIEPVQLSIKKLVISSSLLVAPCLGMYAWSKTIESENIGDAYPWGTWWMLVVRMISYHVAPWRNSQRITVFFSAFILIAAMCFFLIKNRKSRTYLVYFCIFSSSLFLLLLSLVSSEVFGFYYFAGFYLHKASIFAAIFLAILSVRIWKDSFEQTDSSSGLRLVSSATVLALTIPYFAYPSDGVFSDAQQILAICLLLFIASAWIALAIHAFPLIQKFWLFGTVICFSALFFSTWMQPLQEIEGPLLSLKTFPFIYILVVISLFIYLSSHRSRFLSQLPFVFLIVIFLAGLLPAYVDLGELLINNNKSNLYPALADPSIDQRADIFRWIRSNTDQDDMILDPPFVPQVSQFHHVNGRLRSGVNLGYNPLLSHREHLLGIKEAHVYVYIKSTLFLAIRDFDDIYGFENAESITTGDMEQRYNAIDDARLQELIGKHDRLKYFVRHKSSSQNVTFPLVYENLEYSVHQLRAS